MAKIALIFISLLFSFSSVSASDMAEVGLSTTNLELPAGVPLAGYGSPVRRVKGMMDLAGKYPYNFFFAPSQGELDPINTRAMAIKKNGKLVLFVSADFVGITSEFVKSLAIKLKPFGVTRENLIVSGTHTHSGPGAISKRFSLAILAADMFNKQIYNHIMDRVVHNAINAIYSTKSAYLYDLTFKTSGLQKNRRERPGHFDSNARLLLAKNIQGDWMGGLLNYAIHGTAFGGKNMHLSADVPGGIISHLEEALKERNLLTTKLPTILFTNGAEGDVAPIKGGHEGIKEIGENFATQAMAALEKARPVLNPQISYKSKRVWVGLPKFNINACIESPKIRKFIAKFLTLPIGGLMPLKATLTTVSIGDLTLMTWPGEPTTDLGTNLQKIAHSRGHSYPWLLGLTNDYLAYFTTKDEFNAGGYEACSSLYSYRGGNRILKSYKKLLKK